MLFRSGVDVPDTVTAKSLAPIMRGQSTSGRSQLALSYQTSAIRKSDVSDQRALVSDRWKLMRSLHNGYDVTRLFDLQQDPWEIKNQARAPQHQARRLSMAAALEEELQAVGDSTTPSVPGWNLPTLTGNER